MVTVYDPTTKRGFSMAEACKYGVMDNRNYWEGTVSDLLSLSGDKGDDIPRLHNRLSAALMQTYITDAQYFHN